jgi:hypothetical protein
MKPARLKSKPLNLCANPVPTRSASWRAPSLCRGEAVRTGKVRTGRGARPCGFAVPAALAEPRAKRAPIGRRSEGAASRAGGYSFPVLVLLRPPAFGAVHA